MWAYLLSFALLAWPPSPRDRHRLHEMSAIAAMVASTDASPIEALTLMNVAAFESGFERTAKGRQGERGPFQIMPPAASYGAHEALSRLRKQGLMGYMGCRRVTEECERMAEHRTFPAKLYRWAFDPPAPDPAPVVLR